MRERDQITSGRAINRALVDVSLRWGVDPARAQHNPVFWHDRFLNYYDPVSHKEEVFAYLKDRKILGEGFNGAFKLNCSFEELDEAADSDFSRGVDLDVVVGLLVEQLMYGHGELWRYCQETDRFVIVRSDRISDILEHLCVLSYVQLAESDDTHGYRWTERAEPMLKARNLTDVRGG